MAVWFRTVLTLSGAGRSARCSLADLGTPSDRSELSKASIFFSRLLFLAGLMVTVSRLARTVWTTASAGSFREGRVTLSLLARGRDGGGVGTASVGLSHRNSSTAMSSLRVDGMLPRLLPLLEGRLSDAAGMDGRSKSLTDIPSLSREAVLLAMADGAGEGGFDGGFRSALLGGMAGLGGALTMFKAFGTGWRSFPPIIAGGGSLASGDRLSGELAVSGMGECVRGMPVGPLAKWTSRGSTRGFCRPLGPDGGG